MTDKSLFIGFLCIKGHQFPTASEQPVDGFILFLFKYGDALSGQNHDPVRFEQITDFLYPVQTVFQLFQIQFL